MKKILSLILAISLILTLLPSFAYATESPDIAKTQTLTFGEGGITELIWNTHDSKRYTPSITDGALVLDDIQTRAMINTAYSSYTAYAAIEFTAESSGLFELKFKTDNATQTSADVAVHIVKKSLCPVGKNTDGTPYTLTNGRALPAYFIGRSYTNTYKVGRFDFSAATNGVYKNVTNNDASTRVELQKGTDYYLLIYCDLETATAAEDKTYMLSGSTYPRQHVYLSGIKFDPVSEMNFGSDYLTIDSAATPPADWAVSAASGWTINTAISKTSNYQSQILKDGYFLLSLKRSRTGYEPWSQYFTGNTNNNTKSSSSTLQLKTAFDIEEGYYRIKLNGGKISNGAMMTLYVDNQFAGYYDCYNEAATDVVLDENETVLNTVYVTPDDDGTVEVMVASEGEYGDDVDKTSVVLSKISFEFLGKEKPDSAIADKIVIENAPEALEDEGVGAVSAYVLMKDGSKRQISGLMRAVNHATTPLCAITDNNNFIKITTSDNLTFAADFEASSSYIKNGVFTNASGNATGTVTANGNGEATITVNAKVDGVELTPATATIALPEPPAPAEPGEELSGTVTFGFGAEYHHLNNYISAPGYTAGSPAQVPVGTKITLTAKDSDNSAEKFQYWMISGRFYSTEKEITLTVARNTYVRAVYINEDEIADTGSKLVYYWDSDKILWNTETFVGDTLPFAPGKADDITGMRFVGWYIDEETKLTKDTVLTEVATNVVAKYEPLDTEYTVKVNGEENKGKYNSSVSVSAPEAFTYWKLGEEKLSFRRAFEFFNYGNAEITSVFDESAKAVPTVVIEKSLGAAFITYDTPAGYERIEAGIIFGPTAEITVNSANSKANAKKTAAFGQFTAKPYDNEQYARGYQIFKKDGIVRVIYTNAIEMN